MKKGKEIKYVIFTLIVIVLIVIFGFKQCNDKKLILESFSVGNGFIIGYNEVGSVRNAYVTYSYEAYGNSFQRRVRSPRRFPECKKQIYNCKDKLFWVIYSTEDPSKSLINLKIEIQNIDNPKFPDNLNDFR